MNQVLYLIGRLLTTIILSIAAIRNPEMSWGIWGVALVAAVLVAVDIERTYELTHRR